MLTIKLKADEIRRMRKVKTEAEAMGIVAMLLERIEQSEGLKKLGKEPKADRNSTWQHAKSVVEFIVGPGNLTYPPFPDASWYQRIYRTIRQYGMDEAYFQRLGEHARDHMELPVSLDFLITQHARILAGHFDMPEWKRRQKAQSKPVEALTGRWQELPID